MTKPTAPRTEIVFIESNVSDYQTLINGIRPGTEVHVLDASQDGLAQMAAWARTHSGYSAIHVLNHGTQRVSCIWERCDWTTQA